MHDIDMAARQLSDEIFDEQEIEPEFEPEILDEVMGGSDSEVDLAAELLDVSSEQELDMFLGKLMKGAGKFLRSPGGKMLTGVLRSVAKKALPLAGSALGSIVPGAGTVLGGTVGGMLGNLLETEGLSDEELQMEVAKRFIKMARQAVARTVRDPRLLTDPRSAVRDAVATSVGKSLPGLLKPVLGSKVVTALRGSSSGRWVRRGNRIILLGV